MRISLQIQVLNPETYGVPAADEFQRWADLTTQDDGEVCVRIVANDEAAQLNFQYRGNPCATNVLSFPLASPKMPTAVPMFGDIVIAAPVIKSEAEEQGKTKKSHWAHTFIHGLLHLLGYDHQDETQARQMEAYEVKVLSLLGYPDPYVLTSE